MAQAQRRDLAPIPDGARQRAVRMRDGTLLATDVYLPPGQGPFRTLISRLPYDKDGTEFFMPDIARYWVAAGYAVVVQDVRGKARSAGEFQPLTQDVDDGYDTIDWVIAQDWALDRVAMIGDSAAGLSQWAAAASKHPALVAISPRCCGFERFDVMYDGGVFALDSSVYWAAETAIDEYLYDYPGPFDWDIRPVRDVVTQAVGNPRPKWIDEWATLESAHQPSLPDIRPELACLHLCGMFDFVASSQADAWNLASASGRGDHYLVLDAVDHSWAPLTRAGRTRGAEGMRAFLDRYNQPIREFLDAVFERNTAALPRVRWRPYADAEWRTETTWPPAASTEATYWALVGPGRAPALKTQAPDSTTVVSWTHDPESPVPSKSIPFHHLTLPPDFVDLPGRSDVATFVAEPLTAPLTLVGQATAECTLRSSSESTHLFARLFDVDPGGSWFEIAFGRRAARGPWPRDVTVRLSPLGYEVARGHRLAVVMSSSLFPRFALDQGTDGNSWHEWSPRPAIQEVAIGGPGGLRLKVRVWCDEREG